MRQSDLEKQMTELGKSRYRKTVERAEKNKYASRIGPGIALTKRAVHDLNGAIKDWHTQVNGKAGRNASSLHEVALFMEEDGNFMRLSALVCRVVLDQIVHKRKFASACAQIGQAASDEVQLDQVRQRDPKVWKSINHAERTRPQKAIQRLFHYGRRNDFVADGWERKQCIQFGALMLDLMVESTGLVAIEHETTVNKGQVRRNRYVQATDEALAFLRESHEHAELLHPFWMPCVEKPRPWTSLWEGGYHNLEVIQKPAIRSKNADYMSALEGADLSPLFACMNTLQEVPWQVNADVYEVIDHLYQSEIYVTGMPDQAMDPPPKATADMSVEKRRDLARAGQAYREQLRSNTSRTVYIAKTLYTAKLMLEQDRFYLPWFADFRGRLYSHVSYLSPQGDDIARSLLLFREGEPITTEAGENWWKITGANLAGHDKLSLEDRVAWVDDHEDLILQVADDPLDCMWWAEQDEPFQFLAWCLEHGRYRHDPTANIRIPCHIDGSCNGLAIYSLMLRDAVGACATNCSDDPERQDIYIEVAKAAKQKMQQSDPELAKSWLDYFGGEVPRKLVKRPVMIVPYSGTRHSAQQYIMDEYAAFARKHGPPSFVPKDHVPFRDLVWITARVWEAIGEVISGSRAAMEYLRGVADAHTLAGIPIRWTSPSGFPCFMHTKPTKDCEIQLASRGRVRVMYKQEIEGIDKRSQADGVAPNFVHSIDAACLHGIVQAASAAGCSDLSVIHDSFATTPEKLSILRRQILSVYHSIFSGNLLADFDHEVRQHLPAEAKLPELPAQGDFDINLLKKSRYFVS